MCQSKANGGKRCNTSNKLIKKEEEEKLYLDKNEEVPSSLVEEISELKSKHQVEEEYQLQKDLKEIEKIKDMKRKKLIKKAKRKDEVLSRNLKEDTESLPVTKPSQFYLSDKEYNLYKETTSNKFLEKLKENGTLEDFLELAVSRKARKTETDYESYYEWKKNNGETPLAYLEKNDLDIVEAGKITNLRIYDGVRETITAPILLKPNYNKVLIESNGTIIPDKPVREVPGRLPSNYNNQKDMGKRNKKTEINLTEDDSKRINRIADIFGIKKSDVIRNQVLRKDHREYQYHQNTNTYVKRKLKIEEYEKEGGKFRKEGEPLEKFYDRLISDTKIGLLE